jgi:uncharacterized membrane protein YccC
MRLTAALPGAFATRSTSPQARVIGLTGITTVVVMVVAADNPHDAWHQPLLRLMDTLIGIAIGVACKWILSSWSHGSAGEGA